jgi:Ca2+-binding EF-hand superfamily protein
MSKSLIEPFSILDVFAFDLYDKDGSGELSSSEVLHMVQDIFGKSEMKVNALIKG